MDIEILLTLNKRLHACIIEIVIQLYSKIDLKAIEQFVNMEV